MRAFISRVALSLLSLTVLSACGGGTTGTSPSDSLKFSGYAENAEGVRASGLSMSVSSSATNETLVDSGTDARGDFAMQLPADQEAFVVDVQGVGATTVSRKQRGAGTMVSKLSVLPSGALAVRDLFEVQALSRSLCASLSISGDTLVISGDVGAAPCPVTFAIASTDLPLTSFMGSIEATCDGVRGVVQGLGASPSGEITLDLNVALSRGCTDVTVLINSERVPDLVSTFSVM